MESIWILNTYLINVSGANSKCRTNMEKKIASKSDDCTVKPENGYAQFGNLLV